jgi:hypothetical protein
VKFDVQQRYEAPAHDVMALYCDVGTYESLPEFGKISRPVVLDRNELGSSVTLRLRYRFTADLPAAALAVIDPERLTWIDETVYDFDAMTATTRLLPDHYASKLTASATASYLPTAGGDSAIRRVTGDVRVRVLLVGGQVERAIVSGLTEHLAEEAAVVADLLGR